MTSSNHATIAGRGVGYELRELRNARKLRLRTVANQLGWQASKLSRMETGKQGTRVADVASLLVIYDITGEDRARLLTMAERSGERGWWEVSGPLPVESRTMIQLEAEAAAITNFQPLLIPGLLQTPDYTRAVMKACGVPEPDREVRVAARMGRQAILTRDKPPEFTAIIDEMALRRALGGPTVMARQLRGLTEAAEHPNVRIQVLPFEVGGHTGLDGSFSIMDFDRSRPVVHLEHKISGVFLEQPEQVDFFRREADILAKAALDPAGSLDLVTRIAGEHDRERGDGP